ncbi:polysaccharide deacetylase family protein [Ruania alkalisoli]|uniref:Polysaccharide deacetylase family protein n=1 Tax=Ruania alkalisoli TaxID=2779775 RepID=A0A7M1SVL5_9MICO|nr:polysaccharide deacetylase family protein [Ruania alkalisoli]QOR71609.1 polysaccharide deacetylase family protein [Ruania alkalisoli]
MTARLLLTFDDRNIGSWVRALPAFETAGARVTFFVVEADLLDEREQAGLRRLLGAGHTVGSHGARHRNADETIAAWGAPEYLRREIDPSVQALRALGARAQTFAYPNSRRDAVSDHTLLGTFDRLRGGGERGLDLASARRAIAAEVPSQRVLPARGWDTGRGTSSHVDDAGVLSALLRTLADDGGVLVLYAHDIAEFSEHHHVHPERLVQVLEEAASYGLEMCGFDELDAPVSSTGSGVR